MTIARLMQMAAAGVPAGGGISFVGFNDSNFQGDFTLDYPEGTQNGDLLFLLVGDDGLVPSGTPSGWTQIIEGYGSVDLFYRTAGSETTVTAPDRNTGSGGAIVLSFRGASFVQANNPSFGTAHTPPTAFNGFSGATSGNSCICFVWYDDDVQSGDATQTGFSLIVSDFYGSAAGRGCSMNVTYAFGVVDSSTFIPPDLDASGISAEAYFSIAFEIAPS
jgi:hypothetical protein